MCGRFVRQSDIEAYAELLQAEIRSVLEPSYNIAPTQDILVARIDREGTRELVGLRWGLVPGWSQGPDNRYSMINARADSIASKPAYRNAFKQRRCLIAADGFYEWQKQEHGKQPFYIHLNGHKPFAMAGVWEHWRGAEDEVIESCAIITTDANDRVGKIHDRMPVILAAKDYKQWLDPNMRDVETLGAMLKPFPAGRMATYPVSTRVNSPGNNSPDCLTPLA
jgi:putative SOS response-associated peptidase YedK